MLPVVVVHGGAGQIPKDRVEQSMSGVCSAVRAGYGVLLGGGSSMDAVVEAVSLMENNPAFNAGNVLAIEGTHRLVHLLGPRGFTHACCRPNRLCFLNCAPGRGSVLNMKGEVEMDALVMDGRTLASGAVSAVRNVANPIQLARLVMDKVPGGGGGAVKGVCPSSGGTSS